MQNHVDRRALTNAVFARVATAAVAVTLIIWVGLSIFTVRQQRLSERNRALSMAQVIADNSVNDGRWTDAVSLQAMINQLSAIHRPLRHTVISRGGRIFAERRKVVDGAGVEVPPVAEDAPEQPRLTMVNGPEGVPYYSVELRRGELAVQIGLVRGGLNPNTLTSLRHVSIASLLALVVGLGLSWTIATLTSRGVETANRALQATEQRYQVLFNSAPDSIMLLEPQDDGIPIIRVVNEATCAMHGYSRGEIIGQPLTFLDSEADKALVPSRASRILAGEMLSFEAEHLRKDGTILPLEIIARTVEVDGESMIQAIYRDITERRHADEEKGALEAQLHQAQKMEAIGRLAGGIAHDMNNLLGAIMGAAVLLEEGLQEADSEEKRQSVANILVACRRGRELTRNFLGYARKGRYVRERLPINEMIAETLTMLESTISRKITIEAALADDLAPVNGDRNLVGLALMNLCINAVDAVEGEGTITITTEEIELDLETSARTGDLQPGLHVVIHVTDNGSGMDEATLSQAMEPFFTTKPGSEGTGLGLPMVHGTMRSHGGELSITSQAGEGTTVSMLFPAAKPADDDDGVKDSRPKTGPIPVEMPTGDAGILLVEDEKLLRWSGQKLLEKLGYQVWVAEDGRVALDLLEEIADQVSLVVLDLIMPNMDGRETFAELLQHHPDIRVLIASGFSHDEDVDELIEQGAKGFIAKPFDRKDLAAAVAAALADG